MKSAKEFIPHREPFLFVDRIVEIDEEHAVTEFEVRESLDFFRGHYPGNPIMPGVILCESVFQTAAVFLNAIQGERAGEGTPVLTRITNARFRRMVAPGETIRCEVRPDETHGAVHFMRGSVRNRDGKTVMNVDFSITRQA